MTQSATLFLNGSLVTVDPHNLRTAMGLGVGLFIYFSTDMAQRAEYTTRRVHYRNGRRARVAPPSEPFGLPSSRREDAIWTAKRRKQRTRTEGMICTASAKTEATGRELWKTQNTKHNTE